MNHSQGYELTRYKDEFSLSLVRFLCLLSRYMTISDEWEAPEKQPFKDFVSIFYTEDQHFCLSENRLLLFFNFVKMLISIDIVEIFFTFFCMTVSKQIPAKSVKKTAMRHQLPLEWKQMSVHGSLLGLELVVFCLLSSQEVASGVTLSG